MEGHASRKQTSNTNTTKDICERDQTRVGIKHAAIPKQNSTKGYYVAMHPSTMQCEKRHIRHPETRK